MKVNFIEHVRPNGAQRPLTLEADDDRREKVEFIEANDGSFHGELLSTGVVSLTVEHPECELGDCAIVLVGTPKKSKAKTNELIDKAYAWIQQEKNAAVD